MDRTNALSLILQFIAVFINSCKSVTIDEYPIDSQTQSNFLVFYEDENTLGHFAWNDKAFMLR